MTIRERDNGAEAMVKRLVGSGSVRVGVQGQEAGEAKNKSSGLTVVQVASFHEFGLGNNPKRSFIADYVDTNEATLQKRLTRAAERVRDGKLDLRTALEQFGNYVEKQMAARISAGIPPGLTEETIKRKGSSKPLIDTGQLRSSITYDVQMGKGGTDG